MNIETLELALDALDTVGALIEHQYTGTSAGMNALQIACDDCHDAAEALRKEIADAILAMTKDEIQRANWGAVLGTLQLAREYLQKDGCRHTWLDGAIGIAEQGALLPDHAVVSGWKSASTYR